MTQFDIDSLLKHKAMFDMNDKDVQNNAINKEWVEKTINTCETNTIATWNIKDLIAIYVWNPSVPVQKYIEQWIQYYNKE